ncbi:hypothetical protein ACQPW3_24625 [Actinosynnema sp. CA-248983]
MNRFIALGVGLVAFVIGIVLLVEKLSEVRAEAEVVGVEEEGTALRWKAVVRFTTADGRPVTATLPGRKQKPEIGQRIPIRYHSDDPSSPDRDDDRFTQFWPLLISLAAGISGVMHFWRESAQRKNPRADIESVDNPYSPKKNRREPDPPGTLPDQFR